MPAGEQHDTLTQSYLSAMRWHSRKAAFLYRRGAEWADVPDWRLDRQVIRLALFMRERLGFQAGQTIAILAPLSPAWITADLAAIASGGVSAAIDPASPDSAMTDALAVANPDVVFVPSRADADRVMALLLSSIARERMVVFDGSADARAGWTYAAALDLGGTLDSAERAVAFRARARAVPPDAPALFHASLDAGNRLRCETLTQRDALERAASAQLPRLERPGRADAYLAGSLTTLDARLTLYACLTNGAVTTALGTPGHEQEERAEVSSVAAATPRRPRFFDRRLSS